MDFNQNTPLVFHWKKFQHEPLIKVTRNVGIGLIVGVLVVLWLLLPPLNLEQVDWSSVWSKFLNKPETVVMLFYPLLLIPVYMFQSLHLKRARLCVDYDTVSYKSGLPLLSRWLDWSLDLNDIRSKKLNLQLSGNKLGYHPILLYRLSWGVGNLRQLRPAAWILPNQAVEPLQKPVTRFGLVNWKSSENMALLQKQFDELPLINALIQRDIALPKVLNTREVTGLDLMAHPRMKVAVISFFVTLVGAFVLFHLMRHQHYFSQPPFSYQLIAGAFAGLLMFAWLWGEKPNAGNTAEQAGFRGTQVLLACLFAVSAGLCAPSVPLLFVSMLQTSQEQSFELQKSPLLLKSSLPTNIPAIQPTQALEYWQSLKDGEVINLPVSRGFAGLWWQYDSSVLQDKVEAFYSSQPMSTINKRR
jgi:hypothetical protein